MAKTENTEAMGEDDSKGAASREQTLYLIVHDVEGRISQADVKSGALTISSVTRNAQEVVNASLSGEVGGVVLSFKGKIGR